MTPGEGKGNKQLLEEDDLISYLPIGLYSPLRDRDSTDVFVFVCPGVHRVASMAYFIINICA